MKQFFYLAVIVSSILTSCSKSPVEVKPPATNASLSRAFFYPRTAVAEFALYTSNDDSIIIKRSFYNIAKDLVIDLDVKNSTGTDAVTLIIPKDRIKAGIIGEYIISPFLTPGMPQGDIKATYIYKKSASSSTFLLPGMANGILKLTGYNQKLNLISGNFNFRINTDQDPKGGPVVIWEDTQIDIGGSFENLQIK